jgi:ubiquinol-cytochrome c reductase cytochrome c1 subunit
MILAVAAALLATPAFAAGGKAMEHKHVHWHFNGPFGTYDQEALQRGWQVYEAVCSNCHGVNELSFRNLGQKGGPFDVAVCKDERTTKAIACDNPNDSPIVKAIASKYKYKVNDGPDDAGDMFQRPGIPADKIPGPYANDQQARAANAGALPPDLALIIKARHDGANYVYSLLTGYKDAPSTVTLAPGQHYNVYFAGDMHQLMKPEMMNADGTAKEGVEVPMGGVLAMAPPLSDGMIDYADEKTPETVEQYSKDVVEFLAWASEPKMEQRKKLGVMVMIYLTILSALLYWSYRQIWSKEH